MPARGAGTYVNDKRPRDGSRTVPQAYLRVSAGPQRNKYVHVIIVEALLGRELEGDETVDHVDGDTLNNHAWPRKGERWWGNLRVVGRGENIAEGNRRRTRDAEATLGDRFYYGGKMARGESVNESENSD